MGFKAKLALFDLYVGGPGTGRLWIATLAPNMHLSEEIIVKIIDGLITAGLAYIARVFFKVIQNVNTIPKLKQDLDCLYKRVRALEDKK